MKIWQKTLILAAIPIALNAYGVFLMQEAVGRLANALKQQQMEATNFRLLNRLYVSLINASGLYSGYLTTGATDSKRLTLANSSYEEAKGALKQIREQTPRDKSLLDQALSEFETNSFPGFEKLRNDCLQMSTQIAAESKLMALYKVKPLLKQAAKINEMYTALLEQADRNRTGLISEQEEIVQRIRTLIFTLLIFNIAFSAVALFLFRRSLLARLQVVVARSKALASLQDMGPPLRGVDEFAEIDHSISEARMELQAAETFRSQVVAMVAHDMRSPLASAMTSLEMLEAKFYGPLSPEAEKKVVGVAAGLDRLVILIDEFLDLDKLQRRDLKLDISEFSLKELVLSAVASLEGIAAKADVKIDVKVPEIVVLADRNRMRQVVTNLLSNAIKFSYAGGTIVIDGAAETKSWSLAVVDQGRGLSDEAKKELFQPYSRSEASSLAIKGSGLGLFICRWFTDAHGGKLEARANDGPGTTFVMTVPK